MNGNLDGSVQLWNWCQYRNEFQNYQRQRLSVSQKGFIVIVIVYKSLLNFSHWDFFLFAKGILIFKFIQVFVPDITPQMKR